ncbi:phospholipase D family protein [Gordonia sp. VNK1]|uniref:phospholipase D family protein n=1 Tax=Gordonia oleivorans TaxID=3156618 RepID=UPI0032B35831
MVTEFIGPFPWETISRKLYGRRPRLGAIAFVGRDGPDLLRHFRHGDVLVVNASKEAVASHATSPDALAELIAKGIEVKSSPTLHAKVLVGEGIAIVGSANASRNSTESLEAVIVTDDKAAIVRARDFVAGIAADANPIDDDLLTELRRVWEENRRAPVPGVTGRSAEAGLLLRWPVPVLLCPVEDDDLTDDEREAMTADVEQTPQFPLFGYQLGDDQDGYDQATVLLRYDPTTKWIYEPVVVFGSVAPIPGRDDGAYQLVRHKRRQQGRSATRLITRLGGALGTQLQSAVADAVDGDVELPRELAVELLQGIWQLDIDEQVGERRD